MKLLKPNKKWLSAAIGLLFVLLILKILLFLTEKPKITVNYVAEYNKTSRPQNYNPNDNAEPYYQKAFDSFIEMPDELQKPHVNRPADFNDAEQALLEKWLISNTSAFGYFKEASNKPYSWLERNAEKDSYIGSIKTPDLACLRKLTEALNWNAKLNAVKGRFRSAFENILDCYKAGNHKCRPNLLVIEQLNGLGNIKNAVRGAFVILYNSKVEDRDALMFLQNALQSSINNDDYIPSIQTEKYFLQDALQHSYIDNGKGTGRLAWSVGWSVIPLVQLDKSEFERNYENLKQRLYCCLVGPTRNEIVGQIEKVLTISGQIMTKTPWQLKNEAYSYFDEIESINNSSWFLQIIGVGSVHLTV